LTKASRTATTGSARARRTLAGSLEDSLAVDPVFPCRLRVDEDELAFGFGLGASGTLTATFRSTRAEAMSAACRTKAAQGQLEASRRAGDLLALSVGEADGGNCSRITECAERLG
jgi:hypothetical protein